MSVFVIKKGDLEPAYTATLRNVADDSAVDLTTATSVTFRMWRQRISGGAYKVNAAATVVDAAVGSIRYPWTAGDTDEAGDFLAEVIVVWPGARPQSFPTNGFAHVRVDDGGLPG